MARLVPDPEDAGLIQEKQRQAMRLMQSLQIDAWVIFAREGADSTLISLIAGPERVVQNVVFILTADGQRIAILEPIDIGNGAGSHFEEVIPYENDVSGPLQQVWRRLDPRRVALNFSREHYSADGLTHGMYLRLEDMLGKEGLQGRTVSSEGLVTSLRAVKGEEELTRLKRAAEITVQLGHEMTELFKPGVTDTDLAHFVTNRAPALGAAHAFSSIRANRLGETSKGPIHKRIERGQVIVSDMGVVYRGYSSDLKRLWYVEDGDTRVFSQLDKQWRACMSSIHKTLEILRPGLPGYEVHEVGWGELEAHGFRRSRHSYGHQVGRDVHDAGPWLGDRANRYRPAEGTLQTGMVVTLDPTINMGGVQEPSWWCMGAECMAKVTPTGGVPLHELQNEVWTVRF